MEETIPNIPSAVTIENSQRTRKYSVILVDSYKQPISSRPPLSLSNPSPISPGGTPESTPNWRRARTYSLMMENYYTPPKLSQMTCKDYLRCSGVIFSGFAITGIIIVSLSGLIIGPVCLAVSNNTFRTLTLCSIVQKKDHVVALFCCGVCVLFLILLIIFLEKRQKYHDKKAVEQMLSGQNYYKYSRRQSSYVNNKNNAINI
ncbi:uncharacterized protein LOC142337521 [Convolutriloba macropyga]|uniref:uncharacterized protein LOC142337521 n=1 Tax=Convolutriloba macropyga TaxID=536237 RepID=UPI003F521E2D